MTRMEDNASPYLTILESTEPSAPSAGNQRLYIDSTTKGLKVTNSAGVDTYVGAGNLWTTGTAMPGSPLTNQRVTRTDLGLDCYYDGTRWLTTTLYHLVIPPVTAVGDTFSGTNGAGWRAAVWNAVYDLWMVDFYGMTFVATTNTGSAFWTPTLYKEAKAVAYAQTSIASFSTGTGPDTASQFIVHTVAVGALLGTASGTLSVGVAKTSTPGNITAAFALTYRLVIT